MLEVKIVLHENDLKMQNEIKFGFCVDEIDSKRGIFVGFNSEKQNIYIKDTIGSKIIEYYSEKIEFD